MKPVSVDEFCNFKFLSSPKFSPDGSRLCFVVSEADKKNNGYRSYIYQKKGSRFVKLTSGGKERSFTFLNDSQIIFSSNREEKKDENISTIFYKISLNGGEAEKYLEFPIPIGKIIPLKNGDFILSGVVYPDYEELYTGDKKLLAEYQKNRKENEDYEEVSQFPFWHNGSTFTKGGYSALFRWKKRGRKLERLSQPGEVISNLKLSKDEKCIYYTARQYRPFLDYSKPADLRRKSLEDGTEEVILKDKENFKIEDYQLADSFILIIASDLKYGLNTDPDFYKLSYDGSKCELYATYGYGLGSSVGSDLRYGGGESDAMIGDDYYFVSTRFDSSYLYCLKDGKISEVIKREGSIDSFAMSEKNFAMVAMYDMAGQELYDINCKKLSHFNDRVLRGKYVAQPQILNFINADGIEIHGFVLKPIDYDPKKKYPVIIDIHGGPKTVTGPVFYHEMQYWASLGYFVIYCNPRGSDGRGEFMDIMGKYGTIDYEDLMAFCDRALEAYPAMDSENFFETGGSYGGFMTNWIIGHTDRFRACVSQRSISNWFSFYGVADIGIGFAQDQNKSGPWNNPEKLWWHSPMKYADQAKTPTLFIHSFEDYRCPIDQGYQMF
ncbi:MAG: S9 family peptidase, partial [Erysipelotrichaceae bacterium]|nr:S9 family peptidase [Erysipelotrichaceae bacterium]